MEGPNCRLIDPDTALRCDCGYHFASGDLTTANHEERRVREIGRVEKACAWGCVSGVDGALIGRGLGSAWLREYADSSDHEIGVFIFLPVLLFAMCGATATAGVGFVLAMLAARRARK